MRNRIPRGNPGKAQFRFDEAQIGNIQRSVFDRSHGIKTTFDAGYLIPVVVDEVLPGDTYNCNMTALVRMLSPLDFPVMSNMYLECFWFFVPNRLVWTNWEAFNGAQPTGPADSTDFVTPKMTIPVGGITEGSLGDYFGIATQVVPTNSIISLPFRGLNLIWNDWFRDENLQDAVVVDTDNGPDTLSDYVLLRRGKRKDYFTSALPWTQKINDGTVVTIGLSGTAPVYGDGNTLGLTSNPGTTTFGLYENSGTNAAVYTSAYNQALPATIGAGSGAGLNAGLGVVTSGASGLIADLSAASGIDINSLRQAVQLQRLFERDARGGTRYVEILWAHFGVRSPDYRLQRPELLGLGYSPVNVHPVAQTSGTGQTGQNTPQGNLAAFATASIYKNGFKKSFVEHGYIFGLVSVRADLDYQQGTNRMWFRDTRYDYFWPALGHIGEQAILNQEIMTQGTAADSAAFGYTGRYNEYRYKPSLITGSLRSNAAAPLDAWHLAQDFATLPTLGNTFIQENPPISRITADDTVPDFIIDGQVNMRCARPMSVDAIPGWMDHF